MILNNIRQTSIRSAILILLLSGTVFVPPNVGKTAEPKIPRIKQSNEDLLKHAIHFGFGIRLGADKEMSNLVAFFRTDPNNAVQIITNNIKTLDIENKDDIDQIARNAALLASVGSDTALKRLDEMYVKWSGKKLVFLRDSVVRSLAVNSLYLYPPIIKKKPKQVVAILERWLTKEDDPGVLKLGLGILSDRVSAINPEILKNAKGKVSNSYIHLVVRWARLNSMRDSEEVYKEVVKWLEEMITLFEPTELDNTASIKSFHDESDSYEMLVYSLCSKLYANPSVLKGQQEELDKMRQKCLEIIEKLEKKIKEIEPRLTKILKTVKDPKDRSLQYTAMHKYLYVLRLKSSRATYTKVNLDSILKLIQKESSEEDQTKTEHPLRKWTNNTGKFTVEARLVELVQGKVILKKADGDTISLPLIQLSKADQDYVKKTAFVWFPKKPTPKKPAPK